LMLRRTTSGLVATSALHARVGFYFCRKRLA